MKTQESRTLMEDNGYFINTLFTKQASLNISALLLSTAAPIVCAGLTGAYFGSEGLAIAAICAPLFLAASFFGFTISGGAQIVCSGLIAKDELDDVNGVYSVALTLTLIIGIFVCAVLLVFKTPILNAMSGEISPDLSGYYTFFVLNAFATMFIYIPLFFSKVAGRNEIGLVLTGVMSAVSIAVSFVLIQFMGIEGIALGQTIGTAAGFIVSMLMLGRHFKFRLPPPRKLYIKPIFLSGSPLGLTRLYVLLTTVALNALFLNTGGYVALAVFGVVSVIHRFTTSVSVGVSQTLVPLVGVFYEEQDVTSIRQTMKCAFVGGSLLMIITGCAFSIFSGQIAALFGLTENTAAFSAAMPYYAVYAVLLLNVTVFSSYYNAVRKLALANVIAFLQEFALLFVLAYLLSPILGLGGIWLSYPASGVLAFLILFAILFSLRLKNKENTPFLLLNHRFEEDGRYISFSVDNDNEKISEASSKISDFCEENNVPPKKTMLISLSVEEIVTLIFNNSANKRLSSVSVRLFLLDGIIILRIRNTGEKFDAIEYYKSNIAGDIEKSLEVIGMKYIAESANVIYYRQTFGVNSLVVIL